MFEDRLKEAKDASNRELSASLRELDSLKRTNKQQSDELAELKSSLEQKHNELSRVGKEKLKLEHHLNNIRHARSQCQRDSRHGAIRFHNEDE